VSSAEGVGQGEVRSRFEVEGGLLKASGLALATMCRSHQAAEWSLATMDPGADRRGTAVGARAFGQGVCAAARAGGREERWVQQW
jgi:hypothetical protein